MRTFQNFADRHIFMRYNLSIERKINLHFYSAFNRKGGIYMIKKYEIIDGNIIVLHLDKDVNEKDIEEVIDSYFHERQTLIAEKTLNKINNLINTDYFDRQIDDANHIITEAALEIMDDDTIDELDTINDAYKKLIHYSEMKSLVKGYKACLSVMARL